MPVRWSVVSYGVKSAHGWLGAVGFAASAHKLECRRPLAGATREGAPICTEWSACAAFWLDVECRTSHVLGGVVRRVGDDFEARYGYRSYLLETFVDRHGGASFRAAGWRGETAGRGRQGHAATETPKACLDADWRARIPEPRAPLAPLEVGAGRENWAEQEFGGAPLGDARLSARLVTCARHQAEAPMRAFTCAARGDKAKAYYRLQAGQRGGDGGEHHAAAPAEDGAMRAGRQCAELREARKNRGASRTRPVPGPGA